MCYPVSAGVSNSVSMFFLLHYGTIPFALIMCYTGDSLMSRICTLCIHSHSFFISISQLIARAYLDRLFLYLLFPIADRFQTAHRPIRIVTSDKVRKYAVVQTIIL